MANQVIHIFCSISFQIMAFYSATFFAIVLLLLTELDHARPTITATPNSTPAGCEYDGNFFQPGEVIPGK